MRPAQARLNSEDPEDIAEVSRPQIGELLDPEDIKYPMRFARRVLGAHLYPKQQELLSAVASHPRVSVSGANGTGKDFAAAAVAWWWLVNFRRSMVVVMAPTFRQVNDILFAEIRAAYGR